jgi:Glycosyltransferase
MTNVVLVGFSHLINQTAPFNSKFNLIRPKEFPFGRFPLHKLWSPLVSLALWQPVRNTQIIHSFNAIPYTRKPFLVSYEIFLPHIMSGQSDYATEKMKIILRDRLLLENCIALLPTSNFAKKKFILKHQGWEYLDQILEKTIVIPSNTKLKVSQPKQYSENNGLILTFVGNHIARKGGIVALRTAKKAQKLGLPVTFRIISNLTYGTGIPTDCPERSRYQEDLKLLDLENVKFYKSIPNPQVIDFLKNSHFQLLPTLQDTNAFSLIEGCSVATPAITTPIFAIPESIRDGDSGYLLNLEMDGVGEWKWREALCSYSLSVDEHWDILNRTYEDLAEQTIQRIQVFLDQTNRAEHYEQLSTGALEQGKIHDTERISQLIDAIYEKALAK